MLFIVPYPIEAASTRYRVDQYLPFLCQNGVDVTVSRFIDSSRFFHILYQPGRIAQKSAYFLAAMRRRVQDLLRLKHFDLIFIQREALPLGPPIFERLAVRSQRPILFDFDDAIYLSHSSEANRWISWIKYPKKVEEIVKHSAHVIVGNNNLKEYVLQYHQRVSIIPTSIDTERYLVRTQGSPQNAPLTIGWVGSGTTVQYLHLLDSVFRRLARRYDFRLLVIGGKYHLSGVKVICRPWKLKNEIFDLQSFDVGIMPLPDNQWTRGKGGFKAIQYMGVGIPAVASPVGINTEIIAHNENGFLPNSEQEWVDCLSALLDDATLRRRIGLAGRRTVEAAYSVQANAPKLLKLLLSFQH